LYNDVCLFCGGVSSHLQRNAAYFAKIVAKRATALGALRATPLLFLTFNRYEKIDLGGGGRIGIWDGI